MTLRLDSAAIPVKRSMSLTPLLFLILILKPWGESALLGMSILTIVTTGIEMKSLAIASWLSRQSYLDVQE
ncbi:hypothetical protein B0H17DRAFT_1049913 [Mycena rosella]|uniref:Uncharacterized protein n=1 Tax=Mycena rosella TaxID=1033263 RepID=A0AAD7GKA1_MYCRO|nr:hypothetical protein B0H17DRAFT_1049913 [Mycena rosella]